MFDREQCVHDLVDAIGEDEPRRAVREVLERVLRAPGEVADALPPDRAEIEPLLVSPELTVLKVVWGPGMTIRPHDHRMWAAIGVYTGRENNAFFRRATPGLTTSGGKELETGEVLLLGADAIHSVTNPLVRPTGALHVYGGDFFATPRSEWDDETAEEQAYDVAKTLALFEAANAKMR